MVKINSKKSKNKYNKSKEHSLEEIRTSIAKVEEKRLDETLDRDQIELLELSIFALREAERLEIEKLTRGLVDRMEKEVAALKALSKKLRERLSKMAKTPKGLDVIDNITKGTVKLLGAILKWYK